jgi:hypothetical protein
MMSDPFSVGMRELNSVSDQGLLGSVGIIGLANDAKTLDKLSKANAALSRLDPQSTQARDLQAAIDATSNKLNSPIAKGLYGLDIVAQGKQINSAVDAVAGANKTTSTTTGTDRIGTGTPGRDSTGKPSTATTSNKLGFSPNTPSKDVGVTRTGGDRESIGFGTSVSKADTKSTSAEGLSMGTSAGNKSLGGEKASERSGGAYAPGGLVTKPKKTAHSKKGLAS